MVTIRLTRVGAKKAPVYRIVVADERTARDGKAIAIIGTYNPLHKPEAEYTLDEEAAKKWVANGAQATPKVHAILKKAGIVK